jgi:hypothetical protein
MAAVEEQLSTLMKHMKQLANNVQDIRNTQKTQDSLPPVVKASLRRGGESRSPTQPQFIGPTSSDYNFSMARDTLRQMGIQPEDLNNQATSLTSPFPSRAQSPEPNRTQYGVTMDRQEIQHALEVYKEELHPVYPYLDLDEIRKQLLILLSKPETDPDEISDRHKRLVDMKSLGILKMILASVSVLEARGKTTFAQRLVDSVEDEISTVLRQSEVSISDLQILTLTVRIRTSIHIFICRENISHIKVEHILLSLRRARTCLEKNWQCRQGGN